MTSDEVKELILALRGALITNARGEDFSEELHHSIRPDAFVLAATNAQSGFYKSVRYLLTMRGGSVDPPGVARNTAIVVKVISTIWKIEDNGTTDL